MSPERQPVAASAEVVLDEPRTEAVSNNPEQSEHARPVIYGLIERIIDFNNTHADVKFNLIFGPDNQRFNAFKEKLTELQQALTRLKEDRDTSTVKDFATIAVLSVSAILAAKAAWHVGKEVFSTVNYLAHGGPLDRWFGSDKDSQAARQEKKRTIETDRHLAEANREANESEILSKQGEMAKLTGDARKILGELESEASGKVLAQQILTLKEALLEANQVSNAVRPDQNSHTPPRENLRRKTDSQIAELRLRALGIAKNLEESVKKLQWVIKERKNNRKLHEDLSNTVNGYYRTVDGLTKKLPNNWKELPGIDTLTTDLEFLSTAALTAFEALEIPKVREAITRVDENIETLREYSGKLNRARETFKNNAKPKYSKIANALNTKLQTSNLPSDHPIRTSTEFAITAFTEALKEVPQKINDGDLDAIDNFGAQEVEKLQTAEQQLDAHLTNVKKAEKTLEGGQDEIKDIINRIRAYDHDDDNGVIDAVRNQLKRAQRLASEGKVDKVDEILGEALRALRIERNIQKKDEAHDKTLVRLSGEHQKEFEEVKKLIPGNSIERELIPDELQEIYSDLRKSYRVYSAKIENTVPSPQERIDKLRADLVKLGELQAYLEAFADIQSQAAKLSEASEGKDTNRLLRNLILSALSHLTIAGAIELVPKVFKHLTGSEAPTPDVAINTRTTKADETTRKERITSTRQETRNVKSAEKLLAVCKDVDTLLTDINKLMPNIYHHELVINTPSEEFLKKQILVSETHTDRKLNQENNSRFTVLVSLIDQELDRAIADLAEYSEDPLLPLENRLPVTNLNQLLMAVPKDLESIDSSEERKAIRNFLNHNRATLEHINAASQTDSEDEVEQEDEESAGSYEEDTEKIEPPSPEQLKVINSQTMLTFASHLAKQGRIDIEQYLDQWDSNVQGSDDLEAYTRIAKQAAREVLNKYEDLVPDTLKQIPEEDDRKLIQKFDNSIRRLKLSLLEFETTVLIQETWEHDMNYIQDNCGRFLYIIEQYPSNKHSIHDSEADTVRLKIDDHGRVVHERTPDSFSLGEDEDGESDVKFVALTTNDPTVSLTSEQATTELGTEASAEVLSVITEIERLAKIYKSLEHNASIVVREGYTQEIGALTDARSTVSRKDTLIRFIQGKSAGFIFDLFLDEAKAQGEKKIDPVHFLKSLESSNVTKVLKAGQGELIKITEGVCNESTELYNNLHQAITNANKYPDKDPKKLKELEEQSRDLAYNQSLYLAKDDNNYILKPGADLDWLYESAAWVKETDDWLEN